MMSIPFLLIVLGFLSYCLHSGELPPTRVAVVLSAGAAVYMISTIALVVYDYVHYRKCPLCNINDDNHDIINGFAIKMVAYASLGIPPIVYSEVYNNENATIMALTMTVPATVLVGLLAAAGCFASFRLCAASRARSPRGTFCRRSVGSASMPTGARAGRTSTPLLPVATRVHME